MCVCVRCGHGGCCVGLAGVGVAVFGRGAVAWARRGGGGGCMRVGMVAWVCRGHLRGRLWKVGAWPAGRA